MRTGVLKNDNTVPGKFSSRQEARPGNSIAWAKASPPNKGHHSHAVFVDHFDSGLRPADRTCSKKAKLSTVDMARRGMIRGIPYNSIFVDPASFHHFC